MKKLLAASVMALALVAATQQQASAWSHFKFGVGLNVDWACGDNNLLWGVYRCGPTPQNNGPLGGYYAPQGGPAYGQSGPAAPAYNQPGFTAPAPTPTQYQGAPAGTQVASYPQSYYYPSNSYYPSNNYYPASNNHGASYYPMSYYPGANYYYPMSYNYGYPPGFSFYGN